MPKTKTTYIDGFVLVVPKKKVAAYKKMAKFGNATWLKHGALRYFECKGDVERKKKNGPSFLLFPDMVKAKPNETVWFSFIEYKSKAHRNQVNKKVMKEMEEYAKKHPDHMNDMPFDMKRMAYGGFTVEVSG